jgi:hypothetical protein
MMLFLVVLFLVVMVVWAVTVLPEPAPRYSRWLPWVAVVLLFLITHGPRL